MVQTLMRSSHTGWGLASLASDAEDLGLLARYLRSALGSQVCPGQPRSASAAAAFFVSCVRGSARQASAALSSPWPAPLPSHTQGIALLGHSTGCQDIVRFLAVHGRGQAGMPPVLGAVLEVRPRLPGPGRQMAGQAGSAEGVAGQPDQAALAPTRTVPPHGII